MKVHTIHDVNLPYVTVDLNEPVNCTACHGQINVKKPGAVNSHPVLKVVMCKVSWFNPLTAK